MTRSLPPKAGVRYAELEAVCGASETLVHLFACCGSKNTNLWGRQLLQVLLIKRAGSASTPRDEFSSFERYETVNRER